MLFEQKYIESLEYLLNNGDKIVDERGNITYSKQHQYFFLDNVENNFPAIKGKKVFPYLALKEMIWFLTGNTSVELLESVGVKYWSQWKDEKCTIGKSYGYQFRNFNDVDQLANLINSLLDKPTSRRNIINLWNVSDLKEMTLPPCVINYQFSCIPGIKGVDWQHYYVDLHITQRSADAFVGIPYDFMIAGWLLNFIVYVLNLISKKNHYHVNNIHYTCNDYHIYDSNIEQVKKYLEQVKTIDNVYFNSPSKVNINTIDVYPKLTLEKFLLALFKENSFKKYFNINYKTTAAPIEVSVVK